MSRKIDITAEISYSVHLTDHWRDELQTLTALRSRCAVVTTQFLKDRIGNLDSGDCEFFYFVIPEGEDGKGFTTLIKLWDWLAAAGFTRSDLIVAIGGERSPMLPDLPLRPTCAESNGLRSRQQLQVP